ncbi:MAG: metal-dependent transcriptional regulator [Spirochaetaceae bacterium]
MNVVAGLTESEETYLEAIYRIQITNSFVRAKDIAQALNVKPASVTEKMRGLARKGLVHYQPYSVVTLTEEGVRNGRQLLLRHRATEDFLHGVLGVDPVEASAIANRIEHALPPHVLCRLVQFNEHYEKMVEEKYIWNDACRDLCRRRYVETCIKADSSVRRKRRPAPETVPAKE